LGGGGGRKEENGSWKLSLGEGGRQRESSLRGKEIPQNHSLTKRRALAGKEGLLDSIYPGRGVHYI